jgi:hypothetical protein
VPPFHLWRLINLQDFIYQPSTFFRRDAVASVGWLNEDLHFGMDWDLLIRLGQRYAMVPIQERLSRVRIYPETKTHGGGLGRFRELVQIIRARADEPRPPAYWYYLLETGLNRAHQLVDRVAVDPRIASRGHPLVHRTYVRAIRYVGQRIAAEWLDDGWAGPVSHYSVPAGREVRFEGEVPADLAPLTIAVSSRDKDLGCATFDAGPFTLTVPLPAAADAEAVPLLTKADRSKLVPHILVTGRTGSFRLDRVEVAR